MGAIIPGSLLNWALVAISLFNTILLLWLGITLWLNADRRCAGIAATAGGFFLGSAFFISHSALLLSESLRLTRSNTLWLAAAVAPVVLLPYTWYVVLLWYNGYWPRRPSDLRRRHAKWLGLVTVILGVGIGCLVVLGWPYLPMVDRVAPLITNARELIKAAVTRVPIVPVGYALYVLLCVVLSLDSLRRPGLTDRVLGEAARERARPWLMAATVVLLGVAVLVTPVLLWTVANTRLRGSFVLAPDKMQVIGRFDLVISSMIAVVIVLLGRGMTAYELFTGKVLPRKGLARQWNRALLLAGGYGVLVGGALVWGLEPVYAVLATALMMTTFFALLVWSSYAEWERAMRKLRPFVASQRWYEALVASAPASPAPDPFVALCENLLNTTAAYLIPAGPTAAFVSPRAYPARPNAPIPSLGPLVQRAAADTWLILPLDPDEHADATWAVPLWREQGLVGMLLFGPRRDGSLYTQEEIDTARATGERLLDTAASLALSQRLMRLQRERMATTQTLDQRTRRVLHDEVLPLVHTAMLSVAARDPADPAIQSLSEAHTQVSNLLRELPPTVVPELSRLGLLGALKKAVDVEFAGSFAEVTWYCDQDVEARASALSPLAAETLYFAAREVVRNAAKHAPPGGRAEGLRLVIAARVSDGQLRLVVEDNGPALKQAPSPPPEAPLPDGPAGSGQGLALHSTLMAIVGGSMALDTVPGQTTRVQLALPLPHAAG